MILWVIENNSENDQQSVLMISYPKANDKVLAIPLTESVEGICNISEIVKINGIDVFYVASASLARIMDKPEIWNIQLCNRCLNAV